MRALQPIVMVAFAATLLTACGGDDTSAPAGAQQVATGQGSDGSLLSLPQAQQGAEQWWSEHEQALLQRDAQAMAHVDAEPLALVELEVLRAARATNQAVISGTRQPSATRVHVAAEQSWPVPVLAVYDVPAGSGTQHFAVLLSKLNPSGRLVATASAALDAAEPAFDTDAAGYVHMGAPANQLAATWAQWMQATVHGSPAPNPAPFAAGKFTSDAATADAGLLHDPAGHSHSSLSAVDFDYAPVAMPEPVFTLAGGRGGFTILAERRGETLHPNQGQALLQDGQRRNYGVDLAPGQYQQITIQSVVLLATRIPQDRSPAEVIGNGGGIYQEG